MRDSQFLLQELSCLGHTYLATVLIPLPQFVAQNSARFFRKSTLQPISFVWKDCTSGTLGSTKAVWGAAATIAFHRKRPSGNVGIAGATWDDREPRYRVGASEARAGFH